jgi:hypothetical protein
MSGDDTTTPEATVAARAGELQFAIQVPVRHDGALPYLLSEVVDQVVRGFNDCFGDYELEDDEPAPAAGDDAAD